MTTDDYGVASQHLPQQRPLPRALPLELDPAQIGRRRGDEATKFMADLDRCVHGRHSIDPCWGCPGGQSAGNPHLVEGTIIGYDYTGRPYRVPPGARGDRSDWLEPMP